MQTAAVLAGGEALVGMLGRDVLAQAISETSRKVCGLIGGDAEGVLERLDLRAQLETVEVLVGELDRCKHMPDSVRQCLQSVHESVDTLHQDLQELHEQMAYDGTRYLNAWRAPSYTLDALETHAAALTRRTDMLIRVMALAKK